MNSVLVTEHFTVAEFACHSGVPYPIDTPDDEDDKRRPWGLTRLVPLCETLEIIRTACGKPIVIDSGYRTLDYDQQLYDADKGAGNVAKPQGSQHPKGRAADIVVPSMRAAVLHALILDLYDRCMVPHLGGLGLYSSFVHVDVRPHSGHLARWTGTRVANRVT